MMKIDLHVHTKERSSCGKSSEEDQVLAAIDAGLDAIVFSDHDRLAPVARVQFLNDRYAPFKIFGGIELSICDLHKLAFEHLLVLGVQDPLLEQKWSYPALHQFVRARGGFIAIAHPFRFNSTITCDLDSFPPDAIEAYSNNITKQSESKVLNLAHQLGVPVLSNSDAHHTGTIGRYYNLLHETPADDQELIELLKAGQYTCVSPNDLLKT
jgi:histidinol phosphatase-like PHP family hydrolase